MPEPSVTEVAPARFAEVATRVARIDRAVRTADGHAALADAVRLDLEYPTSDSAGFFVDDRAYAHIAPGDTSTPGQWVLGLATTPDARHDGTRRALVEAAVKHVVNHGGGTIVLWLLGAGPDDDNDLAASGLHCARDLFEMRVGLPIAAEARWPEGFTLRHFEPGRDEAEWLDVNNRAFASHVEQGGWSIETLARRTAEPWFDPTLFLLAIDDAGVAGFNWLKIHEADNHDPRVGEIYVIGVDPRAQGTGLGRALAVTGLHTVHERGIDTGTLFCAADNAPALKLYESLGFAVHRVDRAYETTVAPSA